MHPEFCEDFLDINHDLIYLEDRHGRHLHHVTVKSGMKKSGHLLMMLNSNKDYIEEKDPGTNLYPFMLATSSPGRKRDLIVQVSSQSA